LFFVSFSPTSLSAKADGVAMVDAAMTIPTVAIMTTNANIAFLIHNEEYTLIVLTLIQDYYL
jgi:hypothetical protein